MVIASEPTPPGGVAGPVTNEYVPVLLVGSSCQGPFGAMSPFPTMVVVGPAAAAGSAVITMPAVVASIATTATTAVNRELTRNFFNCIEDSPMVLRERPPRHSGARCQAI